MNQKPFRQAERDFFLLKGQLATNRLTRAEFDAALKKLDVRDEFGREWRLESENGDWLIKEQDAWVPALPANPPPAHTTTTSIQNAPSQSNTLIPLLALGGLVGLCLCGVIAYLGLNALGVISTQVNLFRTATPTFVAIAATATPLPSSSSTPPTLAAATSAPSASPTDIFDPATATPTTISNSPTPAATSDVPQTFIAFDADFFAEDCPLFVGENETRRYECDLGEYFMLHKQATTRYTFYDTKLTDAVIEANGSISKGTGKYEYGIVFRANSDGTLYYVFTVTNDGKYNVALYKDDKYTDLIPYTASPYVNTAQDEGNLFKVVMRGSRFDFYLNDHFLNSVNDSAVPSGVAGFFFYNAEPNAEVGFDQLTLSTFTPPTPTATPGTPVIVPTPTADVGLATVPAVKPGLYVNTLRFTPRAPKRGDPVTFYATFVNSTGKPQSVKWMVEIWELDTNKKNPYGQADGLVREIPVGTGESATGDSWKVAGGGPCLPFRARVVYEDDQSRRIPFKQTNGGDLWVSFQVCP